MQNEKPLVKSMVWREVQEYLDKHREYRLPTKRELDIIVSRDGLHNIKYFIKENHVYVNGMIHSTSPHFRHNVMLISKLADIDNGTVNKCNVFRYVFNPMKYEDVSDKNVLGIYTYDKVENILGTFEEDELVFDILKIFSCMGEDDLLEIRM